MRSRLLVSLCFLVFGLLPGRAGAAPTPPPDGAGATPVRGYWNGKLIDLENYQVAQTLVGEPLTHEVQFGGDVWRIVEGRRLQGFRLSDGRLLREFELRGPCRDLFVDDEHVHAVLEDTVETFARSATAGAADVRFPDRTIIDAAHMRDAVAVLLSDTSVQLVQGDSRVGDRLMSPELDRLERRSSMRLVVAPVSDLVCRLEELDRDFFVRCVDRKGTTRWEASIRHTSVGEEGATRDLFLRRVGRAHALFGTKPGALQPRTIVLRMENGERVLDIPRVPGALVEADDGTLLGLVSPVVGGGLVSFLEPDGTARWSIKGCEAGQGAHAILAGERLVVTCYDPKGTGGELFAVDARSGEGHWKAEVASLGRVRGDYENDISVRREGALIFLDGHESALDHIQVFELETGARRYVDVRRKW